MGVGQLPEELASVLKDMKALTTTLQEIRESQIRIELNSDKNNTVIFMRIAAVEKRIAVFEAAKQHTQRTLWAEFLKLLISGLAIGGTVGTVINIMLGEK